jgi:hypothetical protein
MAPTSRYNHVEAIAVGQATQWRRYIQVLAKIHLSLGRQRCVSQDRSGSVKHIYGTSRHRWSSTSTTNSHHHAAKSVSLRIDLLPGSMEGQTLLPNPLF